MRQRPTGLVYQPELIDEAEEQVLLRVLRNLRLRDIRTGGSATGRAVRHVGGCTDPGPDARSDAAGRRSGSAGSAPEPPTSGPPTLSPPIPGPAALGPAALGPPTPGPPAPVPTTLGPPAPVPPAAVSAADDLPPGLDWLRERCAALLGVTTETLGQVLVTRYAPGAVLGWHRYPRTLGPTVIGLSLAAPCLLRFQHRVDERYLIFEQPLAPRSAYVMAGPVRARWEHSIPPVPGLRYSITFRTEGQ